MSLNANEEMLAGIVDASYPDADPDATLLNKSYADADLRSVLCPCTVTLSL